jgi:glucokinase
MYLAIDIGGTKTLVAALDDQGAIKEKLRFLTPKDYQTFLHEIATTITSLTSKNFTGIGVGVPGTIDRDHGIGLRFGNLPWQDIPIQADIERLTACAAVVENDAKLAGLSEAILLKDDYKKVLYLTISTGIGIALIKDGIIDIDFGDAGAKAILIEHEDKIVPWESFASGKAIVDQFGKKASDITDEKTWQQISDNLAIGIIDLIGLTRPDVIVVGGSVGSYFERYQDFLDKALRKYETPLAPIPPLLKARRPEDAVLYGCYELAQQKYGYPTR